MKQNPAARWLLAGMIVIGLTGWVVTGLTLYARIAYLALFLAAGAGIWAIVSIHGISMNRQARVLRASMGDVFEEHFEIRNISWPGTLWLEVVNQSNLPNAGGSRLLTNIGFRQRRFYTARTLLYRRGSFLLGPTSVASGDPLGIFSIRKLVPARDTLVVLPMTVAITDFPPPPGLQRLA